MENGEINPVTLLERIITAENAARAAHARMDKAEESIRDSLLEMKATLGGIARELKEVIAWMNRGKGWAAAALLLGGIVGAVAMALINHYLLK